MSFELFVALRYLKARRSGLFAVFTTVIGIAGVAIGVAALLTTLAVMNGFQHDIRKKIIGARSHLNVYDRVKTSPQKGVAARIEEDPDVVAAAPFVLGQAILTHDQRSVGIAVQGIEPERSFRVTDLSEMVERGSWEDLGAKQIVLGTELASNFGIFVGDKISLVSPKSVETPFGTFPTMRSFTVVGLVKTGYYEFDSTFAWLNLEGARDFFKLDAQATGWQARVKDLDDVEDVARRLRDSLGLRFGVRTFADMNQTLIAALKLEKIVMFLILGLITIVASFNIASNLVLLSVQKIRDIGILKAIGATPAMIRKVFWWTGAMIGGLGLSLGLLLGFGLCWVISRYPVLELPADIYYLSRIPIRIETLDVFLIILGSATLSVLCAAFPAIRASKVDPVETVRLG